jgi:cell division protein FtsB
MRATLRYPEAVERRSGEGRLRLLVWLVVFALGLLAWLYLSRYSEIQRLRHDLSILAQKETRALITQQQLRAELEKKDDPKRIEDLAREWLGLVKPGEEKVIFIEEE